MDWRECEQQMLHGFTFFVYDDLLKSNRPIAAGETPAEAFLLSLGDTVDPTYTVICD